MTGARCGCQYWQPHLIRVPAVFSCASRVRLHLVPAPQVAVYWQHWDKDCFTPWEGLQHSLPGLGHVQLDVSEGDEVRVDGHGTLVSVRDAQLNVAGQGRAEGACTGSLLRLFCPGGQCCCDGQRKHKRMHQLLQWWQHRQLPAELPSRPSNGSGSARERRNKRRLALRHTTALLETSFWEARPISAHIQEAPHIPQPAVGCESKVHAIPAVHIKVCAGEGCAGGSRKGLRAVSNASG